MKKLLANKKLMMGVGALAVVGLAYYMWHEKKEEKCSCKGVENTTPPATTTTPAPSPAPPITGATPTPAVAV